MTHHDGPSRSSKAVGRWVDKLNRKLLPVLGPPPLGPYDEEKPRQTAAICPLCGNPMSEHEIDRSGIRTQLYCPTGPEAA
jgi:hypothetical protein